MIATLPLDWFVEMQFRTWDLRASDIPPGEFVGTIDDFYAIGEP